jgi:hypothetical protein
VRELEIEPFGGALATGSSDNLAARERCYASLPAHPFPLRASSSSSIIASSSLSAGPSPAAVITRTAASSSETLGDVDHVHPLATFAWKLSHGEEPNPSSLIASARSFHRTPVSPGHFTGDQ